MILGGIYEITDNDNESILWYDKAIAINPKNHVTYTNKGIVLIKQKKYPSALDCFDQSIKLNGKYGNAYYQKGICYGLYDHAEL